jgi:uncharacterized protein (TIGR03905 family)
MRHTYKTRGTCSSQISFELDGNVVRNVEFTKGCDGNLKAVSRLVDGFTVDQICEKLGGLTCDWKDTSCGDQLARAVKQAWKDEGN